MNNEMYLKLAKLIISIHKELIGSYAISQANKIEGLVVSEDGADVKMNGDSKQIINNLIRQYEGLFGKTSVQLCKEAQQELLTSVPNDQLPELLR